MSLKEKIKCVIVKELDLVDIDPATIEDDAQLFGDEGLGLDSLDAVELVVLVEKFFNTEIQDVDEGMIALQSVNSLAQFIEERQ